MNTKICVLCGAEYTPTSYNQQRCGKCAQANMARCATCGKLYSGTHFSFYSRRSNCPECLSKFKREQNAHAGHIQSDQARESRKRAELLTGNLKKARAAAREASKTHPHTAKGSPEHTSSKMWILRAPDDTCYEVRNLNAFIREHEEFFQNFDIARKTFIAMGRTIRDPDGDFPHRYSYMGWTMDAAPEWSEERKTRKAYIAGMNQKRMLRRENNAPGYTEGGIPHEKDHQ